MALRLRRGLDLDRVGVIFAEGELVYATDTKRLHIGDGATAGGIPVGDLLGDTSPQLGATLDLNTHSIVGLGTIAIDGNISSTGVIQASSIVGNFQGTFSADDSTILIDGVNNRLVLGNNTLNDIGDVNLSIPQLRQFLKWSGTEWQNSYITLEDLVDVVTGGSAQVGQVLKYDGVNWVPSEDTTASGNIVGDLKGSVFGDDSTVLVDAVSGFLNLSRNMLSDLNDVAVDQATNDQVLAWNGVRWAPTDLGNIQLEYLTGDVKGSVFGDDSTMLVDALNNSINLSNNVLNELANISPAIPQAGDVLTYNGISWEPVAGIGDVFVGDLKGSVFADDSSLIVDSINQIIYADSVSVITLDTDLISGPNTLEVRNPGGIRIDGTSVEGTPFFGLRREDTVNPIVDPSLRYGTIYFEKLDSNGYLTSSVMTAYETHLEIGHNSTGTLTSTDYLMLQDGKLGIGKTPTETLDVNGKAIISEFIQFGSYTTAERDDLTTTNTPQYATNFGMVIYNTTTNTFQGWQNTGGTTPEWVNLS